MPHTVVEPSSAEAAKIRQSTFHPRLISILVGVVLLSFCLAGFFYRRFSPFAEASVSRDLGEASDSTIQIGRFRQTYFPAPGCVLEQVEFRHGPSLAKFITIQKLVIHGSYRGLLQHSVPRVTAYGVHVSFPSFGNNAPFHTKPSDTSIEELIAIDSVIEFALASNEKQPLRFLVHKAILHDVRPGAAIGYQLQLHNPTPPGEISAAGSFGPWPSGHPEQIPFVGEYTFDHADLSSLAGIGGTLSSYGKFEGPLQHLTVSGSTDTPDFYVKIGGHKVHLATRFDAYVDAMHGDTFLNRVEAHLGRTTAFARGSIARSPEWKGKFTNLRLTAQKGRIEDILGLFIKAAHAPMSGPLSLRANIQIPPDQGPFLQKVSLQGAFGINAGTFSHSETQEDVNQLSAGAQGQSKEDPATVMTDLTGEVTLAHGVTQFSDLSFWVPGVHARLHGTYNLISERIDLHGRMRVDTEISNTTSGAKSVLLKIVDPFFKKKKKGEVVPVHILGTYDKPQFGLDVGSQNKSPGK